MKSRKPGKLHVAPKVFGTSKGGRGVLVTGMPPSEPHLHPLAHGQPIWHEKFIDFALQEELVLFRKEDSRERCTGVLCSDGGLAAPIEMDAEELLIAFPDRFPSPILIEMCHQVRLEFVVHIHQILDLPLSAGMADKSPVDAKGQDLVWRAGMRAFSFDLRENGKPLHIPTRTIVRATLTHGVVREDIQRMPVLGIIRGTLFGLK